MVEAGGARTNPALGLPSTSTAGLPLSQPKLHSLVEGARPERWGGGANSRQSSSLFALPIPSQPSSSVLTAVSAAFSVSRAGHGARVLKGVCRGFRENETQGAALSVELRHQSFWDSQTKGGSSKGWILGPGDQGLKRC